MKITDKIKLFVRNKKKENEISEGILDELEKDNKDETEIETIIDEKDMYAYYLKENKKYVLVKDTEFPYWLSEQGIEWIELNKQNFNYYGEFNNFSLMFEKVQKLHEEELLKNKNEDDYLKDYLEHSSIDYFKIIEKMKLFEIDGDQYKKLLEKIKLDIRMEISNTLEKHINMNKELNSTRTYEELVNSLIDEKVFAEKYPFYKSVEYKNSISHCGYPDYMWQSGTERNIY